MKRYERRSANTNGASYIVNTANINGATLRPALIGEAVRIRRAFRWSRALSQRQ